MALNRSTLVGRASELQALRTLVERRVWTTLVGLPGVGKSALARSLATELGPARVTCVDARGALDASAIDAARADTRAVVALAYEPLGLEDEHVLRLGPLALPEPDADVAVVLAAPSVILLLAAAERLGVRVDRPEEHASALGLVARRTSGIPLVLEIAASHLSLLGPEALAQRLADPSALDLEIVGRTRTSPRASVRSTLGPRIDPLDDDARALLVAFAPHARGVRVGSAMSATMLRVLIDRGLLDRVETSDPAETWVRVPFVIGALASARSAPEAVRSARDAHVHDVSARVRAAAIAIRDRNDPEARREMSRLGDDVASALEHAEQAHDVASATAASTMALAHARATREISTALLDRLDALGEALGTPASMFVALAIERAALDERRGDADAALARLRHAETRVPELDPSMRSELMLALGKHLRDVRRDYVGARVAFEQAADVPDALQRARALSGAGGSLTWAERYGEASEAFEAAREAALGVDAPSLRAVIATNLAIARIGHWPSPRASRPRTRDVDEARAAARSFEAIDDRHSACVARQACALALVTLLRLEEAAAELGRMRELARSVESRRYEAIADLDLGVIALAMGRDAEAEAHLVRGLEIATVLDDRLLCAVAHGFLGDVCWERGQLGRARELLARARSFLERDAEHASRLALVLAEEATLGGASALAMATRAAALVDDTSNVHWHAVRVYAALDERRAGRASEDDPRVLPWLAAELSLLRAPASRRGSDGLGIPPAVHIAVRRFVRELDPNARRALLERAYGLDVPAGPTLLVDADQRAVRAPDGRWTVLARRERPFALLAALADVAATRGGTCSVDALVAKVWPGEKMVEGAGANRIYTAATLLRKQPGMRDVIQTEETGYRLAPELDVLVYRQHYVPSSDPDTRS